MSGGEWDYVYQKLYEPIERLKSERCPKRRALGNLLRNVQTALREIELVDSGDNGPGDDIAAIDAALQANGHALLTDELKADAAKIVIEFVQLGLLEEAD